jgi:hypothetical protein
MLRRSRKTYYLESLINKFADVDGTGGGRRC